MATDAANAARKGEEYTEMWSYENLLLRHTLKVAGETLILHDRRVKHEGRDFTALDPAQDVSREILTINIRQPYTKEYGAKTLDEQIEKGADMIAQIKGGEWTRETGLPGIKFADKFVTDAQREIVTDRAGVVGEEVEITAMEAAYAESKREFDDFQSLFRERSFTHG